MSGFEGGSTAKPYIDALFGVAGTLDAVEALLPGLESFVRANRR